MVQRPPARAREDALLQAERLYYRLRIAGLCGELREREREKIILRRQLENSSYDLGERNLAELQMVREHAPRRDPRGREQKSS